MKSSPWPVARDVAMRPECKDYGALGLGANIRMEYLSPICPLKPEILSVASLKAEVKGKS